MTIEQAVMEELQKLSPQDRQSVLRYAQSLHRPKDPRDPLGMFEHRGVHISFEEMSEARKDASISLRLPAALLTSLRAEAVKANMPTQRLIRMLIEAQLAERTAKSKRKASRKSARPSARAAERAA